MSLRDDVDRLLPGWESWYPSLFHAAEDLGLIRARVCSPASLMISQRHASIYNEAVQAFRAQWSAEEPEGEAHILRFKPRDKHPKRSVHLLLPRPNNKLEMDLTDAGDAMPEKKNDQENSYDDDFINRLDEKPNDE